jgi:hypothetical protein
MGGCAPSFTSVLTCSCKSRHLSLKTKERPTIDHSGTTTTENTNEHCNPQVQN